jgi:c-di-GMP-binding flagellar brake protein YcgR
MPSPQEALSKLRENRAVFLRRTGTADWKKSRVETLLGKYLQVSLPQEGGRLWSIVPRETLEIGFSEGGDFFTFLSAVLDVRRRPIPLLVLQRPSTSELVVVQRRRSERAYSLIPLYYAIQDRGIAGPGRHTLALNLSATGLAFNANEPISRGNWLKMEVQISNATNPISVSGEVVACSEVPQSREARYKVRVKFSEVSALNRQRINDFVRQKRRNQEAME